MLNIIVSGIPISAKDILAEVADAVFGKDAVKILDLKDSEVRIRVRMSQRNPSDVLVVLGIEAYEACKSIENGLYTSDKYFTYTDDSALVEFINKKYGLSIQIDEEENIEPVMQVDNSMLLQLRQQIADRDLRIKNQQARIAELSKLLEEENSFTPSVDASSLNTEIGGLNATIKELQSEKAALSKRLSDSENALEATSRELENQRNSSNRLRSDYNSVYEQLSDYKLKYSEKCEAIESYESKISSLNSSLAEASGESSQVESLKVQISSLEGRLQDSLAENNKLKTEIGTLNSKLCVSVTKAEYTRVCEELDNSRGRVSDLEYEAQNHKDELRRLETENSVLKSNALASESKASKYEVQFVESEAEKKRLQKEVAMGTIKIEELLAKSGAAEKQVERLEAEISSSIDEVDDLKSQLSEKDATVVSLDQQLNEAKISVSSLELQLEESQSTVQSLREELANSVRESSSSDVERTELESQYQELKGKYRDMKLRNQEQDNNIVMLNKELLQAKSTVEMLEKSTNRNTDIEALYLELTELRGQNSDLQCSIFNRIGAMSNPTGSLMVNLTLRQSQYDNIRFVFSGSTESRKGTYKSLLDEFKDIPESEKVLLVDVTSETCVDYVFQIQRVKKGLNWFINGGDVSPYLSNTCLNNVWVLSPGLGYVNDCYFLSLDWESRLMELENSGYHIILYCGDISSMVGRVMHESFAGLGSSMVYVHGNVMGARTVVSNMRGISNGSNSIICYFEYSKSVEKFYNMMQRTNECRIISV